MRLRAVVTSIGLAAAAIAVIPPSTALPDPGELSYAGPGFTVRVNQTPFAMQVLNSAGQPVLT